jgi:hypothetical protein
MQPVKKQQPFWEGWFWLTVSRPPEANAGLATRLAYRNGRIASTILLVVIVLMTFLLINNFLHWNNHPQGVTILFVSLCINIFALFLNRRGLVFLTAIITVINITASLALAITSFPGGFGLISLLLLMLFVVPELLVVSLLPTWMVYPDALLNSVIITTILFLTPKNPEILTALTKYGLGVALIPAGIQLVVAVVSYLQASSALKELQRADRAEEIVLLERREIEHQEEEIRQKEELDEGIEFLLETILTISKGELGVQTQLSQNNKLWRVGLALNNLSARLRSSYKSEYELARTRQHAEYLLKALQAAKVSQQPVMAQRGNTLLDSIIVELNEKYLVKSGQAEPKSSQKEPSATPISRRA